MLKKKNRLDKKEFDLVYKNGKKTFSKNFLFIDYDGDEILKNVFKISTTISKKVYKNATDRNRVRRFMYKVLQSEYSRLPKNKTAIFIATKPILGLNTLEVKKEILSFLNKKNKIF